MTTVACQITSLAVVYSSVYLDANQRKHQSSASLALVWGIHRDRWIPRTKGQLRGKCFHLMTSSCFFLRHIKDRYDKIVSELHCMTRIGINLICLSCKEIWHANTIVSQWYYMHLNILIDFKFYAQFYMNTCAGNCIPITRVYATLNWIKDVDIYSNDLVNSILHVAIKNPYIQS